MKAKKIIAAALTLFSVSAIANCDIPNRLKTSLIVNDLTLYAVGNKSESAKIMKEHGFNDYDEYSFSSDDYSKSIVTMSENAKKYGAKYKSAVTEESSKDNEMITKALTAALEKCGKESVRKTFNAYIWEALKGKNLEVNLQLSSLNMHGISKSL